MQLLQHLQLKFINASNFTKQHYHLTSVTYIPAAVSGLEELGTIEGEGRENTDCCWEFATDNKRQTSNKTAIGNFNTKSLTRKLLVNLLNMTTGI